MEDMKNAHKMLITETKEIQVQMGRIISDITFEKYVRVDYIQLAQDGI
jgi:hypothetical protein